MFGTFFSILYKKKGSLIVFDNKDMNNVGGARLCGILLFRF